MPLLPDIERAMISHRIPPSRFGRESVGDPRLVFDLRRGRSPRASLASRVLSYIVELDAAASTRPVVSGSSRWNG